MSKAKRVTYRDEWYYGTLSSALLVIKVFDKSFPVYSVWKKILKTEKCPETFEEQIEYCKRLFTEHEIKSKLPENTHVVVVWTKLGPVFRLAVAKQVFPLREDGFEAPFVSKYYDRVEEVL